MKGTRVTAAYGVWVFALALFGCGSGAGGEGGGAVARAPVILISMDGFRWDYSELTETPNLDALGAAGVRAENLIPVFPSKTFPSHHSMATGLYPGNHGIISNNMRDPDWEGVFGLGNREELAKPRWWGGEPAWITAKRQGLRTASFFWPGSDVEIRGERPDYWYAYDGSVPFEDRVDQVLAWLDLPADERPSFITLYFAEPNETAHDLGPEAAETLDAARRVDAMLGRLMSGLEERGTLGATNIVVVSDHGMAQLDRERWIVLDDLIEMSPDEVLEDGAFVQIFPGAGREEETYRALAGAHPNLAVYRRDEIPERFHLAGNRRLGAIVAIPDSGWHALTQSRAQRTWSRPLQGDHGYDPWHPDMRGIFVAAGPAFQVGVRVQPFENIEIYNILVHALGIEPAPNDGDLSRVRAMLR